MFRLPARTKTSGRFGYLFHAGATADVSLRSICSTTELRSRWDERAPILSMEFEPPSGC